MHNVPVKESLRLDQFLKWAGVSMSGGQAKVLIQSGMVSVNGEETRLRGRMLADGDVVSINEYGVYRVVFSAGEKE
ncbi:MAG: RNA-binding S4 domain-containing protein [Bacillota bacterium]